MKRVISSRIAGAAIGMTLAAAAGLAHGPRPAAKQPAGAATQQMAATENPTPAERQIAAARTQIESRPASFRAHNALALGLARRARETADGDYYRLAEEALAESRRLMPGNLEAERLEIWLLLGQHDFRRALEAATELNRRIPDDLLTYAFLADAHVELGDYGAAEEAVQWMLDLRPGNVPGLTRGAYLREIYGDIPGAVDWMRMALQRTHPAEVEDRAWLLTQVAHLELGRGELDRAEAALDGARALFPDYHYALAELADLRSAQGRREEAVELRRRHTELAPHPENYFYLAEALVRAGRAGEAQPVFSRFERLALAETDGVDNANGELVRYYLEHADRPVEALEIAEREIARRRDVKTLEVYARALLANGRVAEAGAAIDEALAPGGDAAELLFHAAEIASADARYDEALSLCERSLVRNRHSTVAGQVRRLMAETRAGGQAMRPAASTGG